MRAVGIKLLKNRLSEYVRLAASGETVLVTDRERVVAEINPPELTRSPVLADAFLAIAVREGWMRPCVFAPGTPMPTPDPVAPLNEILDGLDADRRDR